jgi:hypothetical protein
MNHLVCPYHKQYKALRKPTAPCLVCVQIYGIEKQSKLFRNDTNREIYKSIQARVNNIKMSNTRNTKNRRNVATAASATITLISPRGKAYPVSNLSQFARRFNLDRSALSKVARGERSSHKNWIVRD